MKYQGLMTKIAAFIGENPGCTGRQLMNHVGITRDTLQSCCAALQEDGTIRKEGERNQAKWFLGEVA